jgi:capsular exopolysaccharide synthesis family protein
MSNLIPFNKTDNTPVPLPGGFDEFAEDEGLDLRHYWRVVLHYKWGILGLAFAVGLFTVVWSYSLQPVYRSTATLLIGGNEAVTVTSEGKTQSSFDNGKSLGTQIELIKSREVARAVMDKLGAARTSILNDIKADSTFDFDWRDWVPPSWLERANLAGPIESIAQSDPDKALLEWLRDNLSVEPVRDTSMLEVSFEATDPTLAASIANAFTRAYLDYNLKQRLESTTEASQWLQEQLEKSRQHVLGSVDSLQQYREEAGLVNIEGMHSVLTHQLKDRTASLSRAHQKRSEAESLYLRARSLQQEGQMDAMWEVRENEWVQDLRSEALRLERQIQADLEQYTENYPPLGDARSNLQVVHDQIAEAEGKLLDGFRNNYQIARTNEARLEAEVKALETSVQELGRKQLEAQALEQTVTTNRQSYDAFLNQLMETSTRSADTVSMIARVVDPAVPELIPFKPNKQRMVMMSLALALMGGLGIALMLDKFDNTLKRREDVEDRLGVPILGELLLLKGKRADGAPLVPPTEFLDEPTSGFAEEIRTIRTGVALSSLGQSQQTLVVTSTMSGEGKSTVALNLALALGQLGNVLLIDADLRRPSLAKLFGQDNKTAGLTDLVAGTAKVSDCIRAVPGGIHVLFAGSTVPPDPPKILSSERFSTVLQNAATTYDSVVIDSAPVELVSDARILATKTSGVVYVIKADHTPHQAVRQGLSALSDTGTPLLGVVLNQIDPKRAQAYGNYKYGYSRYGRYGPYSYGQDPKSVLADASTATRRTVSKA